MLADQLSDYFGWLRQQSLYFVLADEAPVAPLVRVDSKVGRKVVSAKTGRVYSRDNGAAITLTVQPWVSAQTVQRAYREAQRVVLGRKSRSLGQRNLAVFEVVTRLRNLDDEGPSWSSLMDSWNDLCRRKKKTKWSYSDVRTFRRDYVRARGALLFEQYMPLPNSLADGFPDPIRV